MTLPNLHETVLGVFLHDIGKFVQRANSGAQRMPPEVAKFEQDVLPAWDGRPTHWHALWSEAFFQEMEGSGLSFPAGVNRSLVRHVAVFHHKPDAARGFISSIGWLATVADWLSSGMDRKERDEALDRPQGWGAFIKTPLRNPFEAVMLSPELGPACPPSVIPLEELKPGEAILPRHPGQLDTSIYQARYQELYSKFLEEFRQLCTLDSISVFSESLLSLSERFLHAVPSSTVDQPDISLHDHSRAAAAIAAALYLWHERDGSLENEAAIRDRSTPKFRFLAGDLSGIQSSLFRLANQQVKGVNKILRARSFLMSLVTEAAALECREALGLPVFSVIQNAGGRFLMLVPALEDMEQKVEAIRQRIEPWMFARWRGELGLNLALTAPFAGNDLMLKDYPALQGKLGAAIEESKLHPFSTCLRPVHNGDLYPHGACAACGVRPGEVEDTAAKTPLWRCKPCQDEHRLGGDLPKLTAITWSRQPAAEADHSIRFWGNLRCDWHREQPHLNAAVDSAARFHGTLDSTASPLALRFMANYVPRFTREDLTKPAYRGLTEEAKAVQPGELKLFEHIAADALEERDGEVHGEDFLAVLKADVDRLGSIFGQGLAHPSLGRLAGLSRMMDFFFTGYLTHMLRSDPRFQSTYTVYAGGDDLLLIGPWRQMVDLLEALREKFGIWTGNSPQVTISAALELVKPNQPLNRSVRHAEEGLERAKRAGRNRVTVIDDTPQTWVELHRQLENAARLHGYLESGKLAQSFLYRMMSLDRARISVETGRWNAPGKPMQLQDATWRARWGYQLSRNVLGKKDKVSAEEKRQLATFLNGLLGLNTDLRPGGYTSVPPSLTAFSIAIYRYRKAKNRS